LRITAFIAAVAILALSFGGVLYLHNKTCCSKTVPMDAGVHGMGPCLGLCTVAVPTAVAAAGLLPLGWFVFISPLQSHPNLAYPIEKPPA
jgi:hypothetical protein